MSINIRVGASCATGSVTCITSGSIVYQAVSGTRVIRRCDGWLHHSAMIWHFTLATTHLEEYHKLRTIGGPWSFFRRVLWSAGGPQGRSIIPLVMLSYPQVQSVSLYHGRYVGRRLYSSISDGNYVLTEGGCVVCSSYFFSSSYDSKRRGSSASLMQLIFGFQNANGRSKLHLQCFPNARAHHTCKAFTRCVAR